MSYLPPGQNTEPRITDIIICIFCKFIFCIIIITIIIIIYYFSLHPSLLNLYNTSTPSSRTTPLPVWIRQLRNAVR